MKDPVISKGPSWGSSTSRPMNMPAAPKSGPVKTADTSAKPMVSNPATTSAPAADTGPGKAEDKVGGEE
jgi:hypothetical protein